MSRGMPASKALVPSGKGAQQQIDALREESRPGNPNGSSAIGNNRKIVHSRPQPKNLYSDCNDEWEPPPPPLLEPADSRTHCDRREDDPADAVEQLRAGMKRNRVVENENAHPNDDSLSVGTASGEKCAGPIAGSGQEEAGGPHAASGPGYAAPERDSRGLQAIDMSANAHPGYESDPWDSAASEAGADAEGERRRPSRSKRRPSSSSSQRRHEVAHTSVPIERGGGGGRGVRGPAAAGASEIGAEERRPERAPRSRTHSVRGLPAAAQAGPDPTGPGWHPERRSLSWPLHHHMPSRPQATAVAVSGAPVSGATLSMGVFVTEVMMPALIMLVRVTVATHASEAAAQAESDSGAASVPSTAPLPEPLPAPLLMSLHDTWLHLVRTLQRFPCFLDMLRVGLAEAAREIALQTGSLPRDAPNGGATGGAAAAAAEEHPGARGGESAAMGVLAQLASGTLWEQAAQGAAASETNDEDPAASKRTEAAGSSVTETDRSTDRSMEESAGTLSVQTPSPALDTDRNEAFVPMVNRLVVDTRPMGTRIDAPRLQPMTERLAIDLDPQAAFVRMPTPRVPAPAPPVLFLQPPVHFPQPPPALDANDEFDIPRYNPATRDELMELLQGIVDRFGGAQRVPFIMPLVMAPNDPDAGTTQNSPAVAFTVARPQQHGGSRSCSKSSVRSEDRINDDDLPVAPLSSMAASLDPNPWPLPEVRPHGTGRRPRAIITRARDEAGTIVHRPNLFATQNMEVTPVAHGLTLAPLAPRMADADDNFLWPGRRRPPHR